MDIQLFSDTNYRNMLDDLDETYGMYLPIGADSDNLRIAVDEDVMDDPRFWEMLADNGGEIISH